MKTKPLFFLFWLACSFTLYSQPSFYYFWTGRNHPNNAALPQGALDQNWRVSTSVSGPFNTFATVMLPSASNPTWQGGSTNGPGWQGQWITAPASMLNGCGGFGNHGCTSGTKDLYYRIDFTLPSPNYFLSCQMRADNSIVEVFQNSTSSAVWATSLTYAQTLTNAGYVNTLNYDFCNGWVTGNNYIIIHTRSNSPQGAGKDLTGLEFVGWGTNNISITGPANVCQNSSAAYSIPAVTGAVTYQWSFPPGWNLNGAPSTNVNVTPTVPGSGVATVVALSAAGCYLNSATIAVNSMPQPVVNLQALSPTVVCLGSPVTLAANGSFASISWNLLGQGTSQQNPVTFNPFPVGTNNYVATATGANGCVKQNTIAITVKPLPTIFISPNSFFVCSGISNTLTASGGTSYVWTSLPNNPTVNPIVVNLTPPQTVTVVGTAANGCSNTTTLAFNAGSLTPLSVTDVTMCTNATLCTTLVANSSSTWPPVFTWQPGGTQSSSVVVCPTSSTIYSVTATAPITCPNTATVAVTVVTNCCSQSTAALTPLNAINGTAIPSGAYLISSNINVSGANNLSNVELLMMPGVKITVPNGQALVLGNSHLYACGINMWQGIELQDGSFFTNNGFNLIEDAEVAFDIPNTSLATSQNSLLQPSFNNMVFNRNYIGIRIRNADPMITTYPLAVEACVFTSRNLQFTGWPTMIWPNSSNTGNGLRVASSPTTGLTQPYNLQGYPMVNLKLPHSNIPGYIGIQILDVGTTAGGYPNPGVMIGSTNAVGRNDPTIFVLFDNLGKGIEVTDASLTTMNNVFQNLQNFQEGANWTYGRGIHHSTTGLMNARLDLRPFSGSNQTTDLGNRFWDCVVAIWTDNVYKTDIEYNIFRSHQNYGTGFAQGAGGAYIFTNRFDANIRFCEFNNIHWALHFSPHGAPYDMGSGVQNGVYAGNVRIEENYFGPEVSSATPVVTEFLHHGINLTGQNVMGASWQVVGDAKILSNKLNRVYRGIKAELTDNYPIEIGGNEILLEDDYFVHPTDDQYGIYAHHNQGQLIVNHNIVSGQGVSNNRVKLIRLTDHVSNGLGQYPEVVKNEVSNAYKGFAFEGFQPDTRWECNTLYTPLNYGFCLEQSNNVPGVVGPQGNPCMESGNEYMFPQNWAVPNYYTWCDAASNPNQSPLYVALFQNSPPPAHASAAGPVYMNGGTFISTFAPSCNPSPVNDCPMPNPYAPVPNLRTTGITRIDQKQNSDGILIYPNPSSGNFTISGYNEGQNLRCKMWDVSGKLVMEKELISSGTNVNLNLDLQKGIYLLEIKADNASVTHKKLIIE